MTEELIPADLDTLPIGSVIPVLEDEVPEGFEPFDGRTLDLQSYPRLRDRLIAAPKEAMRILEGWGVWYDPEHSELTLSRVDPDLIMQMMWGVVMSDGPELVLAIKAERRPCPNDTNGDGDCGKKYCPYCGVNSDGTSEVHSDDPAEGQPG